MRADLHTHTNISDGYDSIEELIEKAYKARLTHIAVTNHDDMDGFEEISERCAQKSIKTVKSIELTTFDEETGLKAHILGYNIKDEKPIRVLGDAMLKRRHNNGLKQIEILNQAGYILDEEEIVNSVYKVVYKQNIMRYIINKGYTDRVYDELYYKFFGKGGLCDFRPKDIDTLEAVKAVKNAGGKVVLAHPGQQQNFILIDKLYANGLDGVEYNHYANTDDDKKIIIEKTQNRNMFLTGGTDYHGKNSKVYNELGTYLCPEGGVFEIFYE